MPEQKTNPQSLIFLAGTRAPRPPVLLLHIYIYKHIGSPSGALQHEWNYAEPFFLTADMLKEIFDHIPQFSMSNKNVVLDKNLS